MWNIFGKEDGFPYEIQERGRQLEFSFCSLHDCTHKTRGGNYSVFKTVANSPEKSRYSNLNLHRLKTLRHPNVLTFVDDSEEDHNMGYVVTEKATPLLEYLGKMDAEVKREYTAWGILKIAKALVFCHGSAKILHNNVGSNAVFVDGAGEWKLAEFGVSDESYCGPVPGTRAEQYHHWVKNNSKVTWELDTYGMAVLVLEAFQGRIHSDRSVPEPTDQVPEPFRNAIKSIFNGDKIPTLQQFLDDVTAAGGFRNDYIENITFLEEIHLKTAQQRSKFFNEFHNYLKHLPDNVRKFKIFPSLMLSYDYGCEGCELLPSVLEFCKTKDPEVDLVPMISRLYHSKSRKTRKALLENMSRYVTVLAPSVVNDTIYPMWEVGFQDTCDTIRTATLESTEHLVPLLNQQRIGRQLLPRLVSRLMDEERSGVRETALKTVLNIIGNHSERKVKKQLLLTVIAKVLKDEHSPIKKAAIDSMVKLQDNFTQQDVATKLMPPLCLITIDKNVEVKRSAIAAMRSFLDKIEEVEEVESTESVDSPKRAISWTEWAKTKITSRITNMFLDEVHKHDDDKNIKQDNHVDGLETKKQGTTYRSDIPKEGASPMETTFITRLSEDGAKVVNLDQNRDSITELEAPTSELTNNKEDGTEENNNTPRKVKKLRGPQKLGTRINQRK